ncbi:Histone deacetylase family protein [Sulfitobacter noctilucicola]|uniref:Acetoin utilization deacetylase AcuC-like enzyme n=1 Tax=Sulfitobacter noctilucicola TaxID=1342301 RepID=A0A7W6Q4G3_9RHOB|nr:class II histone deacetylase [Sulfitobacter noctilucicola]KIN63245.1 Histone deacetylase family protein [Sulfitobacter noctilucicola]MBB4175235.1 acetoin utilization deacetylase AcuC-like enzyme [Sulfitobacter noctilucicola]
MSTGFFWDERCFWHGGGNYAATLPIGGLVQPLAAGGLPESPETKRRLKNLMDVTGLSAQLDMRTAPEATREMLERIHPASYLDAFKATSDAGGGELGHHTPFAQGGYEIATLSAGLAVAAVDAVASGALGNAYALSRPPGHHCTADEPMGFCLLANIAIAIEAARAKGLVNRVAVLDWDVHHGNGTQSIFYDRSDVLTISLHQHSNYPLNSGMVEERGTGDGAGYAINLPMHAGSGHTAYLHALDRVVIPALEAYQPDMIVVACGYDAASVDPLARMQATAETFSVMTHKIKDTAARLCDGKLVMVHEGGYSEVYVPFCGHAVMTALSGSDIHAADPMADVLHQRQPAPEFDAFLRQSIDAMALELDL